MSQLEHKRSQQLLKTGHPEIIVYHLLLSRSRYCVCVCVSVCVFAYVIDIHRPCIVISAQNFADVCPADCIVGIVILSC